MASANGSTSDDWSFPGALPDEIMNQIASYSGRKTASDIAMLTKSLHGQSKHILKKEDMAANMFIEMLTNEVATPEMKFSNLMQFLTDVRPELNRVRLEQRKGNTYVQRRMIPHTVEEIQRNISAMIKGILNVDVMSPQAQMFNMMHLFLKLNHFYAVPSHIDDELRLEVNHMFAFQRISFHSSSQYPDRAQNLLRPSMNFAITRRAGGRFQVEFFFRNHHIPFSRVRGTNNPDIFSCKFETDAESELTEYVMNRMIDTLRRRQDAIEEPGLVPCHKINLNYRNKIEILQDIIDMFTKSEDNEEFEEEMNWRLVSFSSMNTMGDETANYRFVRSDKDEFCENLSRFIIDSDFLFKKKEMKTVLTLAKFSDNTFVDTTAKFNKSKVLKKDKTQVNEQKFTPSELSTTTQERLAADFYNRLWETTELTAVEKESLMFAYQYAVNPETRLINDPYNKPYILDILNALCKDANLPEEQHQRLFTFMDKNLYTRSEIPNYFFEE